jgi:hypothetical protein
MGAHLICEDLLAIGDVFDSTPQQVADWAAVNSVEVAQARGFEPRSSLDLFGDKQKASPRKEGSPLVAFDEEQPQPQPQGGPPPMPRAGTSNGSLGKLSTALQRLFPNSSFGSEGSEQSQAHRQKKRARSKGNVVVVQTMRAGQAGETPVLVRTCCRCQRQSCCCAVLVVCFVDPSFIAWAQWWSACWSFCSQVLWLQLRW